MNDPILAWLNFTHARPEDVKAYKKLKTYIRKLEDLCEDNIATASVSYEYRETQGRYKPNWFK